MWPPCWARMRPTRWRRAGRTGRTPGSRSCPCGAAGGSWPTGSSGSLRQNTMRRRISTHRPREGEEELRVGWRVSVPDAIFTNRFFGSDAKRLGEWSGWELCRQLYVDHERKARLPLWTPGRDLCLGLLVVLFDSWSRIKPTTSARVKISRVWCTQIMFDWQDGWISVMAGALT